MKTVRIELGRVWKARNQNEGRYVPSANCLDLAESGDGPIIARLCRKLANRFPQLQAVSVFRDGECVFAEAPVKLWCSVTTTEPTHGSVKFTKFTPYGARDES